MKKVLGQIIRLFGYVKNPSNRSRGAVLCLRLNSLEQSTPNLKKQVLLTKKALIKQMTGQKIRKVVVMQDR